MIPRKPHPASFDDGYTTRQYGCVRCQKHHRADTERAIFDAHIMWQSKHGVQDLYIPLVENPTVPRRPSWNP